ncbi:MAG: sulfatase-like hydrolase/transferase [Ktedonobacteraceae bacterium]
MPTEQPNILVIMTDDHAQWAAGCYGNRELRTPTLDYLASTGVRMENAFTPIPVCSPARASFFTGRLPSQHGLHDYLLETEADVAAHDWLADEMTIAQILSEAGYHTALIGKWHCGNGEQRQAGFDHWFSLGPKQGEHRGQHTYWENAQPVQLSAYKTSVITDHALGFLAAHQPEQPFFLFVGYTATHSPWSDHPERIVSPYRTCTFEDIPSDITYPFGRLAGESLHKSRRDRREALAQYYAAVTEVDEQVGRIVDHLDAHGLREHTLIVYVADHGLNCSHHSIWGKGNGTRPLNMVEESIRIPLIFNNPKTLFAGLVRTEFVDHCDLFQTLLDYAHISFPQEIVEKKRYPGRSFKPLLQGSAILDWKTEVFGEYGNLRMLRTRTHKLVLRYPEGPCELFDLTADPRETSNLFHSAENQPLVQALTVSIETFFARHEDPQKSGLRICELPRHNPFEAWRGEQV